MTKSKLVFPNPLLRPEGAEALNDHFKFDRSQIDVIYDWGPTLTRQEFADEADINVLMERYERTGVPPVLPGHEPMYLDVTGFPDDLQGAMNQVIAAEAAFMRLPATVRREFYNDPVEFVQFASDPENIAQMRSWGLAPPEKLPDPPQRVEVVNPVAPPADRPAEPPKPS